MLRAQREKLITYLGRDYRQEVGIDNNFLGKVKEVPRSNFYPIRQKLSTTRGELQLWTEGYMARERGILSTSKAG